MSRVGHPSPQMANQHKTEVHPLASSSNDDDINRLAQLARYSTAAIEMYERNRHLSSTTHKGHQVEQLLERRDDAVYHQRNHARSREIQNTRHPQWKVPTSAPPSHSRVGTQLAPSGYHSFHFGHHQYLPQSRFGHGGYPIGMQPGGGMVPLSSEEKRMLPHAATRFASSNRNDYHQSLAIKAMTANHLPVGSQSKPQCKDTRGECSASRTGRSRVLIPSNLVIPKEITASTCDTSVSPTDTLGDCSTGTGKRSVGSDDTPSVSSSSKRQKKPSMDCDRSGFDKLNMLCSATLNLGPLQANPTGCSCPKSKCVALYCDCFKAGRRCDPRACSCVDCKNTIEESGQDGARTKVSSVLNIIRMFPTSFLFETQNPNALHRHDHRQYNQFWLATHGLSRLLVQVIQTRSSPQVSKAATAFAHAV